MKATEGRNDQRGHFAVVDDARIGMTSLSKIRS